MIKIFIAGWILLLGAILLNLLAKVLNLRTWYDYIGSIQEEGWVTTNSSFSWFELVFLYVIYPLGLGYITYLSHKYLL